MIAADRKSLHEAMQAFREKNPPPDRQGGFLQKLEDRLGKDKSTEATTLARAIEKLRQPSEAGDVEADRQAFMDALQAYFEKQRPQIRGYESVETGQVLDTSA